MVLTGYKACTAWLSQLGKLVFRLIWLGKISINVNGRRSLPWPTRLFLLAVVFCQRAAQPSRNLGVVCQQVFAVAIGI